jgi:hypothetical protein
VGEITERISYEDIKDAPIDPEDQQGPKQADFDNLFDNILLTKAINNAHESS